MPHDLFGDVVTRPQSVRSRRSPLVLVSLAAHGVLLAGLVITSVVAPDALPFPEEVLAWDTPRPVRLVDIPLPKAAGSQEMISPRHTSTPLPVAVPESAAPTEPPDGVTPETGNEGGGRRDAGEPTSRDIDTIPGTAIVEPPPPAPVPDGPVRLHAGIRTPRKVTDVAPVYPVLAQRMRVDGVVILEATIDARGVVQAARVLRSVPLLDQAAVDAVRQWRFEPALLNNQPIAVLMTVTVRFTLQ